MIEINQGLIFARASLRSLVCEIRRLTIVIGRISQTNELSSDKGRNPDDLLG